MQCRMMRFNSLIVVRFCLFNRTLSELLALTYRLLLVVLAPLVAAGTLGMLASLLALTYPLAYRLLLRHL